MGSLLHSKVRLSLLAWGIVSMLVIGAVALTIVFIVVFVMGAFVTMLLFMALALVVAIVANILRLEEAFFDQFLEVFWGNSVYMILAFGLLLLPMIYLKPVKREIRDFKRELGTDGTLAEDRDPKRAAMVRRLAQQADIAEPTLRIVNRSRPESYALGGPSRGTIIVTRGVIRQLDDDELEAVLAHEVSHLANGDSRVMTPLLVPMMLAEDISSESRPPFMLYARAGMLYLGVIPYLIHLFLWSIVHTVTTIQSLICKLGLSVFSRKRELAADRAAAELTGSPSALASALQKLHDARGRPSEDKREFARSAGALDILPLEDRGRLDWLFRTHPDVETRIAHLEGLVVERETK